MPLRKENKIKVGQPLKAAYLACANRETFRFLKREQHLIADGLNVKELFFEADESKFVFWQAKPNFRLLGKRLGKRMKETREAIANLGQADLQRLREGGSLSLSFRGGGRSSSLWARSSSSALSKRG